MDSLMSEAQPQVTAGRDLGFQLADRLAGDIFSGTVVPGELLLKETELSELFGISRASVRAGLQTLESLGIIRRQAGQGTIVEEYREWNILDPLVTRWMVEYANPNPAFLCEIFEFRFASEPFISAVAASRATAHDLATIEAAYLGMERSGREGKTNAFTDADMAFHTAIYRATHNLVWAQLAHILGPTIMLVVRKTNESADELNDTLERHKKLFECIRLRQPEAAFDAAIHVMQRSAFDLGITTLKTEADRNILTMLRARAIG